MTHLLIIWSKGLDQKEHILNDIKEHFDILNIYQFDWNKKYFSENLKRFYSHSQYKRKQRKFNKIIKRKIKHCGDGKFIAVVFDDLNPKFEQRNTSSGVRVVNTNVFDRKSKYRDLTGGGHKIHASDDAFETNKDLSLLFGMTTEDLKKQDLLKGTSEVSHTKNVLGVPYWNSVQELFFAFNNSIDYVVLRNFECLPDQYNIEGHGDIDLMVENLNYVKYLTGAKPGFPRKKHRCYYYININNEQVPFDFRHVSDNYYDVKWQLDILKTRELTPGGFYIPNTTNYFYSLLYHAIVQKPVFGEDYKLRILNLSKSIPNLNIQTTYTTVDYLNILSNYIESKTYNYVIPKDHSVHFNQALLCLNEFSEKNLNRNKELVSIGTPKLDSKTLPTEVYKYLGVYIKRAFNPICTNEMFFLEKLKDNSSFPNIIKHYELDERSEIYIKEVEGFLFSDINLNMDFWQKKNVTNTIKSFIDILIMLVENDILHRDIRPENIILNKKNRVYRPILIDFGWAIDFQNENNITPLNLGNKYKYKEGFFSDPYSVGKCLSRKIKYFNYIKPFVKESSKLTPESYKNKTDLLSKLNTLKTEYAQKKFSFIDHIALNIKRIEVVMRLFIKAIKY